MSFTIKRKHKWFIKSKKWKPIIKTGENDWNSKSILTEFQGANILRCAVIDELISIQKFLNGIAKNKLVVFFFYLWITVRYVSTCTIYENTVWNERAFSLIDNINHITTYILIVCDLSLSVCILMFSDNHCAAYKTNKKLWCEEFVFFLFK